MSERTKQELVKYTFPLSHMVKIPLEMDPHTTHKTSVFYKASAVDDQIKELNEKFAHWEWANTNNLKVIDNLNQKIYDQQQQIKELKETLINVNDNSGGTLIFNGSCSKGCDNKITYTGPGNFMNFQHDQLTAANEKINKLEFKLKTLSSGYDSLWEKHTAANEQIKELEEDREEAMTQFLDVAAKALQHKNELTSLTTTLAAIDEKIEILRIRNLPEWHRKTSQQNNLLLCEQIITLIAKQMDQS